MRIGMYQFASTGDIDLNLRKIKSAIELASKEKVDLLVFHECALCGYPPIETCIEEICKSDIESALKVVSNLADSHSINVAIGTIRFESDKRFNSVILFGRDGHIKGIYDKRALWGWDVDNYERGNSLGIFDIEGVKVGFRICFDVRFPELFRELYVNKADLCIVCFSDTSQEEKLERYNIIKSHLITRAVENVMPVVSVNSTTGFQTAPTAVINQDGETMLEADTGKEIMLTYEFQKSDITFGMKGRMVNSDYLIDCQ